MFVLAISFRVRRPWHSPGNLPGQNDDGLHTPVIVLGTVACVLNELAASCGGARSVVRLRFEAWGRGARGGSPMPTSHLPQHSRAAPGERLTAREHPQERKATRRIGIRATRAGADRWRAQTGLVMALWLTRLGVPVRIIDKTTEPGTTSRAVAVQARTLEFYRQIGLADAVIARGHHVSAANMWVAGRHVARAVFGDMGAGISPYGTHSSSRRTSMSGY